ncbi:hypothetical protein EVAR_93252_1 [Eumeta japonica]|uniref:Uncharacterized protein n=1 Tax=Eumeta variegata TaxID=151549 RepID=A0A4C1TY87_EUMVA|nr:hypothetical protein EVAR_93252_1 [Eumeta japonica]
MAKLTGSVKDQKESVLEAIAVKENRFPVIIYVKIASSVTPSFGLIRKLLPSCRSYTRRLSSAMIFYKLKAGRSLLKAVKYESGRWGGTLDSFHLMACEDKPNSIIVEEATHRHKGARGPALEPP